MRTLLLILTSLVLPLAAFAQEGRGIGYPTVAAALEALRARSDVNVSVQGGWTIVDERLSQSMRSKTQGAQSAPPSEIEVQRLGDDSVRLVLKSFRSSTSLKPWNP